MDKLEDHKKKIELMDRYGFNDIKVNKNILYDGDYNIFNKKDKSDDGKKPLAASVIGVNNTNIPLPNDIKFHNCWTDADAQEAFLKQKPKCFFILGKQGTGSYSLGEALAKKINCIHLCPKNVLIDEIEQGSPTGKCLDFNMRHNKVCKFDIIFSIIMNKLKSSTVDHRGFVITGLPLVTSCQRDLYLLNTLISEESLYISESILLDLLYDLKKKKPKTKQASSHSSISSDVEIRTEEEQVEEEQEPDIAADESEDQTVELPKFLLQPCHSLVFYTKANFKTKKVIILQQMQQLFELKPDIIIFISCPNSDVITKRAHKFLNYLNNSNTFHSFGSNVDTEIRWPTYYIMMDLKKTYDSHVFNPKYNCKQPMNFQRSVSEQLCNFNTLATPFIEDKFKDINPQYIIKLDGRISTHQMIHDLLERFLLMPVKPVPIPEPLYLDEPPEDSDELWKLIEELNVIRSGVLSFNRYASLWYNRCPVELKKRQSIQGNAKFAVTFFKHVYLLSSIESMIKFCRNPRAYLKLEYLEPTCRIIILGTKSSGKTMIANCLSWLFNTPVIYYTSFLEQEKKKKYDRYAKTILSEIMPKIEEMRLTKWQKTEMDRIFKLNTWFNTKSSILNSYISLFKKKIQLDEGQFIEDLPFIKKLNSFKNQISFMEVDDLKLCEQALNDNNLLKFAPSELIVETSKPLLPALGDEDVSQEISAYIVANDLQKDIEPTPQEIVSEIIKIIKDIDSKATSQSNNTSEETYGKYIIDGFTSDSEYWTYLIESRLLPDYTISLIENREIDIDLIEHYFNIQKYSKNYQERYLLSQDIMIKMKLKQDKPPDTTSLDVQIIRDQIITDVFDLLFGEDRNQVSEGENDKELINTFSEAMDKVREEWGSLKLKIEDNFKACIEVLIEDKSDIQVVDEVLVNLRKCYSKPFPEEEEVPEIQDDENESMKDVITHNDSHYLGETNIYCPVAFYDYGVLWEGKTEFLSKYQNKLYYTSSEDSLKLLQYDITKYLFYNKPFKKFPPLRLCVIGNIGSGKTTISQVLSKELGLIHIDFEVFINEYLIPKHFKKVGWQYENTFTDVDIDEEVENVEIQTEEDNSNSVFDFFSNEKELRRIIFNYLERGSPLPSVLVQFLIKKLWFENPYINTGVIIDGFPKLPSDVEDMVVNYCIPDIIIELESVSEVTLERLSPKILKKWKTQQSEAKTKAFKKIETEKKNWLNFITEKAVVQLIIEEIFECAVPDTEELLKTSSVLSTIIDADPTGSSNLDANLFTIYKELVQEYPEPVDQTEWEKADDVLERINSRLESIFEIDDENIQTLKDILYEQRIKILSLDGKRTLNKVSREVLTKLSDLRYRCESFFEQTFIVSGDIAEMLLLEGFFLLSKFYRMCPVYIKENPFTLLNPYNISKHNNKVFPIIHRAYIYFISSEINVKKFRKNPLVYIQDDTVQLYKEYPLRIGIIGPPKSGKSKLAAKLAKHYGLICISRGLAIRYILENMHWTALGTKMLSLLQSGDCIDNELVMKAVLTVAMDKRTMTNGFVLDGFPDSPYEACELSKQGLYPIVMLDINANKEIILNNACRQVHYEIFKRKPPYSGPFIEYRFTRWSAKSSIVRNWIDQDTQNLYSINGNNSKWQCYMDALQIIEELIPKIHYYLTHSMTKIVRVDMMGISNEVFEKRMSCYKNVCPVCLHKNILRHSGYPPDKKGLVQYNDLFYWICSEHLQLVLQFPKDLLEAKNITIPEIPARVKTVDTSLIYENGICIVTYAENLPAQKIVKGFNENAAIYRKRFYLFCSHHCLLKFLAKPHIYYNIKVFKNIQNLPKLTLKEIPHLGYLEQSVGSIITEACCAVNMFRPKYPGLDVSLSALLYIALFLKANNRNFHQNKLSIYRLAFKTFEARCKLVTDVGLRLRSMNNPFATYPKCCPIRNIREIEDNVEKQSILSTTMTLCSELEYDKLPE